MTERCPLKIFIKFKLFYKNVNITSSATGVCFILIYIKIFYNHIKYAILVANELIKYTLEHFLGFENKPPKLMLKLSKYYFVDQNDVPLLCLNFIVMSYKDMIWSLRSFTNRESEKKQHIRNQLRQHKLNTNRILNDLTLLAVIDNRFLSVIYFLLTTMSNFAKIVISSINFPARLYFSWNIKDKLLQITAGSTQGTYVGILC